MLITLFMQGFIKIIMLDEWKPKPADLVISAVLAIGLPFLTQILYIKTGALIPMIIYYGLAWGLVKWRRGSTGYFNKFEKKVPISFLINLGVIGVSLVFAYFARIKTEDPQLVGVILTGLIWATVNASSEQLLWIYIYESWDLYFARSSENKTKRIIFQVIGLLLFTAFVGLIHTMFWVNFLHTVDASTVFGVLFLLLTTISGYLHLVVWRKSNQMVYTFIPHFILNLIPLFWTGFSIIPYLWI